MYRLTIPRANALLLTCGLLLLIVQPATPQGPARQALLFIALWLIPTYLWMHWLKAATEGLERFCAAAGLALLTTVVITLLATYVPGAPTPFVLTLAGSAGLLLPVLASALWSQHGHSQSTPERTTRGAVWFLVFILLLAAGLRLINLAYKEFQGDEGVVMVRAAQALLGDEMALLRHQKGPVEILLPLLPWGLGGAIDELWARAPFVWAGWLVIPSLAALGRRWLRTPAAFLAALLFTIGGFSIAFSRIVQYQSLVMLWTVLSLIFADRYRHTGQVKDLLLCASFLAGGLLAHYDAVLVAPAVAWLVLDRWRSETLRSWLAPAVVSFLTGTALLALFYGPYLLNPTIGGTGSYLLQDRLGGSFFSWSVPVAWRMATFYNSTYYVVLLLVLAMAGVVVFLRQREWAAILFLLAPLCFYTLVVADPRTHIYTIFPALTVVAATGLDNLYRRLRQPLARGGSLGLLFCILAASLLYVYLLFVEVNPERQRTWQENRPPAFPVTWSEPPQYGLFGFPHQAGWRLAPALIRDFPYASNEEPEITDWYMAQAPRTHCPDFETFVIAANAQDALPYDEQLVASRHLDAIVTVNGTPSLHVYGNGSGAPRVEEATGHSLWRTPAQVVPPLRTGETPLGAVLGDSVRLMGYTLDGGNIAPGATISLTLYWQALAPIERNYQVFVHLYDGEMWAQSDGAPDCAFQPTSGWEPGQIIRDAHRLQLRDDAPAGTLPLLVGMYDLLSEERLPSGGGSADHILLTELQVHPR